MNIVTGLFKPKDVIKVIRELRQASYDYEDLSLISKVANVPDFIDGEPEESAAQGAAVGAAAGGVIGLLGSFAVSTIPGLESSFVSGLMATSAGSVIGGYLGSIYTVRAESQTHHDVHQALEEGDILLVVHVGSNSVDNTVDLLNQNNGYQVETHQVTQDESESK